MIKTDWTIGPALIGQAGKETPCTLAQNTEEADPDERIPSGKRETNMQCYVLICCIYVTVAEWRRINSVRLGDKSAWHRVHPMSHRLWVVRIWPTFSRSYPPSTPFPAIRHRFDRGLLLSPACHSFVFHYSCSQLITSNLRILGSILRTGYRACAFSWFSSSVQTSDILFGPVTLDLREIRKLRMSFLSCS